MENMLSGNQSISGISCAVKNCEHNCENRCYAQNVTIGPQFASCSGETVCDTFKPKC